MLVSGLRPFCVVDKTSSLGGWRGKRRKKKRCRRTAIPPRKACLSSWVLLPGRGGLMKMTRTVTPDESPAQKNYTAPTKETVFFILFFFFFCFFSLPSHPMDNTPHRLGKWTGEGQKAESASSVRQSCRTGRGLASHRETTSEKGSRQRGPHAHHHIFIYCQQ